MNEIKLNKLSLYHFQGGTFIFEPNGEDAFVFGQNTSGKTRLVSAFTYLLFNKDALGRSDFSIKDLNTDGEIANRGIDHSVEAELLVDDKIVTLKKIYREKWTRKRGSANKEFSGNEAQYFIDGVPIQEKDYLSRISEIAGDESRFRLLTSPVTFPALHWQKQRTLLLEVCGDLSDNDVILSNEKLTPLTVILGKHTLDDHRKIVTARRSEINKEIEKFPIRIDEVRRGMPDITGIDKESEEKEVQELEVSLNDAKLSLQGVNTGGNIADLTRRLSGLNADLRKLEDAHRSKSLATINQLNQQISEIGVKVGTDRRRVQTINGELNGKQGQLQRLERDLISLREQWAVMDAAGMLKITIADVCPSCGQPLPSEKIQEAKDKTIASFNHDKAERLGEIYRKGHDLKEQRDRLRAEIDALKKELEVLGLELPTMESKLKALTDERDALKESSEDFSGLHSRPELLDEIEDLEAQIKGEREGKAQDIEKITTEIANLRPQLQIAKTKVDLFGAREQGEKRIEELKAEEKTLSAEFEKLEGELYLCDLFVRQKVSMLTTRINDKFETVRFKLFDLQVNGALAECCQITVNGVPFDSGLNNGARINAGLEIVKVLQQHYKLKAPVFADNAEAVNNLVDVGCQMIRLYVSEDKTLRVEVQDENSYQRQPNPRPVQDRKRQGSPVA